MMYGHLCGVAIATLSLASALVSSPANAAFYYEATTTNHGQGLGRNGQVTRVVASIDGPQARIEFVESGDRDGPFRSGSYLLTNDAGETLFIVNPAEQSYARLDLDAIFGFASAMFDAAGGAVQLEFSDLVNEKIAEEPAEPRLGYATTRYEFRTAYTMSMSILGFRRASSVDTQLEIWCTNEIDAEGFSVWLRPDRFRTGNDDLDTLIAQQYQDIDCLPLRTRSTTTTAGDGRDSTTTSETEVTLLREETGFDSSVFTLPANYTEASFMPEMSGELEFPQFPEQTDGDANADAEEDERPRVRLRDLLRR